MNQIKNLHFLCLNVVWIFKRRFLVYDKVTVHKRNRLGFNYTASHSNLCTKEGDTHGSCNRKWNWAKKKGPFQGKKCLQLRLRYGFPLVVYLCAVVLEVSRASSFLLGISEICMLELLKVPLMEFFPVQRVVCCSKKYIWDLVDAYLLGIFRHSNSHMTFSTGRMIISGTKVSATLDASSQAKIPSMMR